MEDLYKKKIYIKYREIAKRLIPWCQVEFADKDGKEADEHKNQSRSNQGI